MENLLASAFIILVVYPISGWLEHYVWFIMIGVLAGIPAFIAVESDLRPAMRTFVKAWIALFTLGSAVFVGKGLLRVHQGLPLF